MLSSLQAVAASNQWAAICPSCSWPVSRSCCSCLSWCCPRPTGRSSRRSPSVGLAIVLLGVGAPLPHGVSRPGHVRPPAAPFRQRAVHAGVFPADRDSRLPPGHGHARAAAGAEGRVLPHRDRRHRGADAPRAEQPLRDVLCRAGDGHGRVLHPRELFPDERGLARGAASSTSSWARSARRSCCSASCCSTAWRATARCPAPRPTP